VKRLLLLLTSLTLLLPIIVTAQLKPVIGISDTYKEGVSTVPRTYVDAVLAAGGIPVIVPLMTDDKSLEELLKTLDGIIFTGGGDFDPAYYNEMPIPQNGKVNAPRDEFDIKLLQLAVRQRVPVLGICRGLQLINVAFGGSLYQDLPVQYHNQSVAHRQKQPLSIATHSVVVEDGTVFASIMQEKIFEVNSAHHQAIKKLADGFCVSGKSSDGVIEAIENVDKKYWVIGVQFHPEALFKNDRKMGRIFDSLIAEATQTKEKRAPMMVTVTSPPKTQEQQEQQQGTQTAKPQPQPQPQTVKPTLKISKSVLLDKIKGGWAGQTIGVCYGGPTEFRYNGIIIPDSVNLAMKDGQIKQYFNNDDIYMDLTFVAILDRLGFDAPVDSFAVAFANAGYSLWHANQAARYNILHGIMPPASGHWHNNPHADDIDYQIESDFAGLMSPAMPNTASAISDRIGHIMNYGDGWYGGVYVGAMYALAFTSDDIPFIVTEALKTIPEQSRFYKTVNSVIASWHKYPDDWKASWNDCQKAWSNETGCPDGVFLPFNIDASINAAYIVLGLLYGNGDFDKTLEISTRAGQDSDCNPSSAGGILGVIKGYSGIPEYHLTQLHEIENTKLSYTDYSLNEVYQVGYNHAVNNIQLHGGIINGDSLIIKVQKPQTVRFEKSFEGIKPLKRQPLNKNLTDDFKFKFSGVGIVIRGGVQSPDNTYVALVQVSIDGKIVETVQLPANFHDRRHEIFWNYELKNRKFKLTLKWLNPRKDTVIRLNDALIYGKE
jgi:gamma-glutamyl-gamma-aminobutyrate hydrolase PuuD